MDVSSALIFFVFFCRHGLDPSKSITPHLVSRSRVEGTRLSEIQLHLSSWTFRPFQFFFSSFIFVDLFLLLLTFPFFLAIRLEFLSAACSRAGSPAPALPVEMVFIKQVKLLVRESVQYFELKMKVEL